MTPPNCFRLNRYNWLGQKLLAQHRYNDLLRLRYLNTEGDVSRDLTHEVNNEPSLAASDHLTYITGLAMMKTSTRLDELVYTLQRLDIQKNGQHFLLLCQCLLYLGNHDAVVALCKQVLSKEIDSIPASCQEDTMEYGTSANLSNDSLLSNGSCPNAAVSGQTRCLQQIYGESIEFNRIFESVNRNLLINDPRLWFTFALSLEFQLQCEDADLAYRVACKLATGQSRNLHPSSLKSRDQNKGASVDIRTFDGNQSDSTSGLVGISSYHTPHRKYSEFCIRHRGDYRMATQVLNQAARISAPIDYTLQTALAATLCSQTNSNTGHFESALETINTLDNHSISLRNPAFVYNQLALKCKHKLSHQKLTGYSDFDEYLENIHDEERFDLYYVLIKSHVVVNALIQSSAYESNLYKCPSMGKVASNMATKATIKPDQMLVQIDRTLDALRRCNSNCWTSYALWNNLGICYLLKRRYIASLSCLTKAHQINPIDWRINYNLALVFLHVDLPSRALCHSLTSKKFRCLINQYSYTNHRQCKYHDSSTDTLIAISYSELFLDVHARRFYAEMIALTRDNGSNKAPLLALINYLLLEHKEASESKEIQGGARSVIRMLDMIEQAWLQRDPNSSQFARPLLSLASQVSEISPKPKHNTKKAYAWTKLD